MPRGGAGAPVQPDRDPAGGALEDRFLDRARPLGEARLLWEIGPTGRELRRLRSELGFDSGYLSRLLRALESAGLITVGGEARTAGAGRPLTKSGRAERGILDQRSDDGAGNCSSR